MKGSDSILLRNSVYLMLKNQAPTNFFTVTFTILKQPKLKAQLIYPKTQYEK